MDKPAPGRHTDDMELPKNLDNAFNRLFDVPLDIWQEELDGTDIIETQDRGGWIIHHGLRRMDGQPIQLIQVPSADVNLVNLPELNLIP